MSTRNVYVVGVGTTKFEKPGVRDWDYPEMAREAGERTLADAGVEYEAVEQAIVGYCYGDSTSGERAVYSLGLTGIPIYNVNNNCSTGSTALFLAKQLVEGGQADCVLALGFEKMNPGSLGVQFQDRSNPLERHFACLTEWRGLQEAPPVVQLFGNAGLEYMERYGAGPEHFALIGEKNHRHSVNNPNAQFQQAYTLEEIQSSPMVFAPLTKLQCCPTSEGAAAALVVSERFVREHGLDDRAVCVRGMSMKTDFPSSFEGRSCMALVGSEMTRAAAHSVYDQSGLRPQDVDVVELHDCFSSNEMITYEGLGLAEEGEGWRRLADGDFTYGGATVVNPSGGLISKGHPLGATGLAQCGELCLQLRGEAGPRQVSGARHALQHNLGLGGAAVVTLYEKPGA